MIEVKNLQKSFGDHVVLNGIDQKIEKGEKVVVIGPSGSGKSTFLRCLNRLEEPTGGEIWFEGNNITDPSCSIDKLRQKMGMVFQQFNLFPHLTVMQNLTLAPTKLGLMNQGEADKKAKELLERVGLPEKADTYPNMLSGGQKQRISIARVFLKDPRILILDEATSALDNESERHIQKSLEELAKNRTCITIAHRLSTIRNADEIIVISENGMEERGTHNELLAKGGTYAKYYHMQFEGLDFDEQTRETLHSRQ